MPSNRSKRGYMETISPKLIISIPEARKLLGKDAHTMSDDQVKDMIVVLTSIAEQFLQNDGS